MVLEELSFKEKFTDDARRSMDSFPSAFGSGELKCKMLNTESAL